MKLKIGVIFGGQSLEHELSIITALQAMDNIDTDKYDIVPIYITKDLVWYSSGCLRYIDSFNNFNLIERYATKVNLINKNGRLQLVFLMYQIISIHQLFAKIKYLLSNYLNITTYQRLSMYGFLITNIIKIKKNYLKRLIN